MAAADAGPVPIYGKPYRLTIPILDADGDLVTGATGLDTEISLDGGTFADATNEATEIATSSGMYYIDLTAANMTAYTVAGITKTSSSGAKTTPWVLYPQRSALGIVDAGVAQAVAASTLTLAADSPAFGTNTCAGMIAIVIGGTNAPYPQARKVLSNTSGAGGILTFDSAFTVTPTGTTHYTLIGAAPDAGMATALLTIAKLEAAFASSGVFSAGALVNSPAGNLIRSGSVTTTGTTSSFTDSAITETGTDAQKYKQGRWTSGANIGRTFTFTASTGTAVSIDPAMPNICTSGDAYNVYQGSAPLLSVTSISAVAAAVASYIVEGTVSILGVFRLIRAHFGGKSSGLTDGYGTVTVRDGDDTKDRVVAIIDANGNRTSVTTDLT